MADTTDIEKKSLEAHVELCAERYRFLEEKLVAVDSKIEDINNAIRDIKTGITGITEKHNRQIVSFGAALTISLLGIIGYLLTTYVLK